MTGMRPLNILALAALLAGAGPGASPLTPLLEVQAKTGRGYATALDKFGTWCLQKKLPAAAREAFREASSWDPRNAKLAERAAAEAPETDEVADPKVQAELESRRQALHIEQGKAFAKAALGAAKAKSWGMARRLTAQARRLHPEGPDLPALDKLLAEGEAALKALDAEMEQAKSSHVLNPASGGTMEYLLKLPKDHGPESRCPLYIHIHGSGGTAKEGENSLESFRGAGFAVLGPTCESSRNKAGPDLESRQVLAIVDRLAADFGIDPDRVFLDGHSGGGNIAYTMIDKHRDRLRGVIPIEANFFVSIGRCAKPEPFPVFVIKGERDEHNASQLNAQIAAALEALKKAQFTRVTYEVTPEMTHSNIFLCEPQRLAWCQDILAFRQADPKK